MTHLDALLVLNAVRGLGSQRIKSLIQYYGSPQDVLKQTSSTLYRDQFIPEKIIRSLLNFPMDDFLKKEWDLIKTHNVQIVTQEDSSFPEALKEIPSAPILYYQQGQFDQTQPAIALVGSRRSSVYGQQVSERFAASLAELGVTVVSGLARGIDTAAHRGALRVKGSTVAVVGCGLSRCYPAENKKLKQQIVESNGAVISEFSMTATPLPQNFPKRNRIISGLSLGVIVIEAALKSGALITADFALEQGREVYAVPGPIGQRGSEGPNHLIKQGAKVMTSIDDVLEDLHVTLRSKTPDATTGRGQEEAEIQDLDEFSLVIWNHLKKDDPTHIDEISFASESNSITIATKLTEMEMKGFVRQLPGKYYIRKID